jgi:hypothetical protein
VEGDVVRICLDFPFTAVRRAHWVLFWCLHLPTDLQLNVYFHNPSTTLTIQTDFL